MKRRESPVEGCGQVFRRQASDTLLFPVFHPLMYSPEFELLLLSLRADASGTAERAELLIRQYSPDFDDLLRRAAMHCVRPQLAALV